MRRVVVILLVIAQLAVLAYMAGNREYILTNGFEMWLQTAPIDPRDPFRGDFVRLQFGFNTVPVVALPWFDAQVSPAPPKGTVVYARMKPSNRGVYTFDEMARTEPPDGVFLKGRVTSENLWRGADVIVNYGIGQLFVQQGKGKQIEAMRGARDELQVPMEVLVAVGGDGTGVIKDYRWSEIGTQLEVVRVNRRNPDGTSADPELPASPKLRVTMRNVSSEPLALYEHAQQCQFVLVRAFDPAYRPLTTPQRCMDAPIEDASMRQLAPQQDAVYEIDLAEAHWVVELPSGSGELGAVVDDLLDAFRIVYRSPSPDELGNVTPEVRKRVWLGQLPSRAFNAAGWVD